ncbi:cytosolic bidirectional (NiFe)-hydrogenase (HDR linked, Group 3c), small subunit [Syntrophobacter sp. SbD2]|nr:cytosolic bidirectional (NiFe)-hydrogenase (HDR linked, Group 3c), small subunit [Syntrophobacter sp. SbD2]
MSLTLCSEALSGCSGCEMSLLNAGGPSLSLLDRFDILHMPILMDHKYFEVGGPTQEIDIPKAGLGLISGAIRNEQQLRIAEKMRRQCDTILAFGTCAAYGGIPAMMNLFEDEDLFRRYYRTAEGTDAAPDPLQVVPPFLERTFALDEKITVDFIVPGCPPHPDIIASALESILEGKAPQLPLVSVCDSCPAKREGKGPVQRIRRFVKNARYQTDKPISEMRCLLDQGFLCMGPVTLAGCAGMNGGPPRCIEARVPCRGCHGPVRKGGNQIMDMLNALVSNGIDTKNLADRLSLLRFSGAHGRLNRRSV